MSALTCPVCQGAMREANKNGILIDICTQCRGVWLDRGELEKLSAFVANDPGQMPSPRDDDQLHRKEGPRPHRDWDDDDDDDHRYRDGRYRKKSRFGGFMDFFD